MPAMVLRAPRLSNRAPNEASALPKVSSPESVCIGDHEPPFGVPSMRMRAPSTASMRCQVSGLTMAIARAKSPPIEWATMRTGRPVPARTASAASTASASRRASSSIGRRQSKAKGMTSCVSARRSIRSA